MEGEDTKTGFKVKDRRRFDSEGNERVSSDKTSGRSEPEPSRTAEPAARTSAKADADARNLESDSIPESDRESEVQRQFGDASPDITFNAFVMSLATQAAMQMGVLEPPEGYDLPLDREGARQTIDILNMLQAKTTGNLDDEEAHVLKDVLHKLKMSFLNLSA